MSRVIIGAVARLCAGVAGITLLLVSLFGEVTHSLLPGASAHIALFVVGAFTLVRAWSDDHDPR